MHAIHRLAPASLEHSLEHMAASAAPEGEIVPNRPLVLVAIDGSRETEWSVQHAVGVARQRGADVHVIRTMARGETRKRSGQRHAAIERRLAPLIASADRTGVAVELVTLQGRPEHVIPAYAQLTATRVIIVGHCYAASRFRRAGAVTSRLSRSSPVPVVVLPARGSAVEATPPQPTHILAAVDFTVASMLALRTAVDLSRRRKARLTVVHAMDVAGRLIAGGEGARHFVDRIEGESRSIASHLTSRAAGFGADDAEALVVTGDSRREIVDAAIAIAADLIVVGATPRTRLHDDWFGATLPAVLRHATTPVLVLPIAAGARQWLGEAAEQGDVDVLVDEAAIATAA